MTSWVTHLWLSSMGKNSFKTALQNYLKEHLLCTKSYHLQVQILCFIFSYLYSLYLLHVLVVLADFKFYLVHEWGSMLQSCLIPDFGGNALSFSPFRMMSDVAFLYIPFIMLT